MTMVDGLVLQKLRLKCRMYEYGMMMWYKIMFV